MSFVTDDQSELWSKFYSTLCENPELWALMQRFSFEAINAGFNHYSARTIFERIRWHYHIETSDPDFKINDHWPPYFSRVFMWAHPQHGPSCWRGDPPEQRPWGVHKPAVNDGFFELRTVDTNFAIEEHLHSYYSSWRSQ